MIFSRIFPLLAILIGIGLFIGFVHPRYTGTVAALTEEIAGLNRALQAAVRFDERQAELIEKRNAIGTEERARVAALLPDGVDNVQLILDLDALANRSGLSLENFETTDLSITDNVEGRPIVLEDTNAFEISGRERIGVVALSVRAIGTYNAFRQFITGVERSLRLLDLTEIEITTTATGVYTYNMTFHVYWLK